MPQVKCSYPNNYGTDDSLGELALKLLNIMPATIWYHITEHQRLKESDNLIFSSAGTSEEWQYCSTCWDESVAATKLSGPDKVLQLLESCKNQLFKGLTHAVGGSLTSKSDKEVL